MLQKMSTVITFCFLALQFFVNYGESSLLEGSKVEIHANSSTNRNQLERYDSRKIIDIQVHGFLLWASMGFLMPVGILAMRVSSCSDDIHPWRRKILFYVHAVSQVVSVLAVTIGAVLSIRKFENAFDNSHQRIGLALYAAVYFQLVIGCRRPKRGNTGRQTWYFLHWLLGTTICSVGILNTYTGFQAYRKKTSKSATLWAIVFTTQVSFMAILYLFQDKWDYIVKQGVSSGGLNTSPTQMENQVKEVLSEPRKSNALGTHFLRTNALNKLFQLT